MSNLTSFKKPYPTMPNAKQIFKVEKDPQRLIEKEINILKNSHLKSSLVPDMNSLVHSP